MRSARVSAPAIECLIAALAVGAVGLSPAAADDGVRRPHWATAPSAAPIVHQVRGAELLSLTLPATPQSDFERFYVYREDGIQAAQPGRPALLWTRPFPTPRKPMLLLTNSALAVFATGFEIFALDAATGRRLWRWGAEPVGLKAVGSDLENFPRQRYFATDGTRIVALRSDGHAVGLNVRTGKTMWAHVLAAAPSGPAALAGERFVYPAVAAQGPGACLCNATTGRLVRVLPAPAGQSVQGVFFAPGGRVLLVSAGAVAAFVAGDGAEVWSQAVTNRISLDRVALSADALYLAADGYGLHKLALNDGVPIWDSPGMRVGRAAQVTLGVFGERIVLASGDEATLFAAGDGRRLARASLPVGREVDRWEILDGRLIGLRRVAADTVEALLLDPRVAESFTAPAAFRFVSPTGCIDTVAIYADSLVLGCGGAVVSFAAPVAAAAAADGGH